jgi:putative DNA primase/helicase
MTFTGSLSAADYARTWNLAIAAVILGPGVPYQDIGHRRRWDGLGGFSVDRRDGAWWCFGTEEGGYSAVALARFLLKSSWDDADVWVRAFITQHQGVGSCATEVADDDASETRALISAFRARQILAHAVPIDGTDGARYLAARGLGSSPYPIELKWAPDARPGEGAIVAELVASGRTVGVLLTYVDALGAKSVHRPNRRRFNLEPCPGAVMSIPPSATGEVDIACDAVIVEGLENLLSIACVRHPAWRLVGLPGIGVLCHLQPARKGERIIVFRDGDPEDSPATKGLQGGVDVLLLAGAVVRVTATPPGADANSLLQDPKRGLRALRRLLAKPAGAALSFEGEVGRLAGLPETAYEKARKAVAAEHGVRVGHLDREVGKRRPKPPDEDEEASADVISVPEDPPWTAPLPPLAAILEAIAAQIRRFVVMAEGQITAVVLWIAASHLVHSAKLQLEVFPKLAIQSKDPESGKSRLLTLVWNTVSRAKMWTNPTGAFLVRAIEQGYPSLCLDELQYAEDRNLLRVIDASQYRVQAFVPLLVPTKNGAYVPREFPVWTPMALARLGEFSSAQQSRSIVIWMLPKLSSERRDRLWPIVVPGLVLCRRQLAAWAATVNEWVQPSVPEGLYNRGEENWEPLLFVAEHAGGVWVERVRAAAEALTEIERQPTQTRRLLVSIWKAYQPQPDKDPASFLASAELLPKLHADADEDWNTAGPAGRPITAAWLRERLRHLLKPPNTQRPDHDGPRGYAFGQFTDAFARYVGPTLPVDPIYPVKGSPETSGPSGPSVQKPSKTTKKPRPDGLFHDPAEPHSAPGPTISDLERSRPDDAPNGSPRPDGAISPVKDERPERAEEKLEDRPPGPDGPDDPGSLLRDNREIGAQNGRERRTEPGEKGKKDRIVTGAAPSSQQARRRRKPPNGEAAPDLGLPPAPVPHYQPGTWDAALVDEVRRLHQENPKRSIAWLGKRTGQPRSIVQAILRPAGATE